MLIMLDSSILEVLFLRALLIKTMNSSIYFLFLFLQSKLSQPQMHIVSDLEGMGLRHFVYMIQVVLVRVFICKSQSIDVTSPYYIFRCFSAFPG